MQRSSTLLRFVPAFFRHFPWCGYQNRFSSSPSLAIGVYHNTDSEDLNRESLIKRFKLDKECRVLIANPAACAESISLHTACHDAIYLDRSFNCAHYLQSLDRIHRLGLSSSVKTCYHILLAEETVDEVVHNRLKVKMQTMRQVLEGDLPRSIPGYWSDDLGEEENVDLTAVEKHIKSLLPVRERKP